MAGECITPAAGVVAEGAFEGLLAGVQLDVAQQIPLLCEGGPTLVTVERPFPCRGKNRFQGTGLRGVQGRRESSLSTLWRAVSATQTKPTVQRSGTWGPLILERCGLQV